MAFFVDNNFEYVVPSCNDYNQGQWFWRHGLNFDDHFVFEYVVPGATPRVTLRGGKLNIEAEGVRDRINQTWFLSEEMLKKPIVAIYKDGILTIRVPRVLPEEPEVEIPINGESNY